MKSVFIIAEGGVNHNGDIEAALRMIDAAAGAGANAIKFQAFKAESIASRHAPKAQYQKRAGEKNESQLEMLKRLELDEKSLRVLFERSRERGIDFLCSPFDLESIDLLERLGLEQLKIPSGEITNLPYLRKLGALGRKLILSTGMADLGEIEGALDILTKAGTPLGAVTLLHCNTEYPTPFEDVNLLAMVTIKNAFPGVSIGYSDHTVGAEVSIAAVAMGATVIEKHFTLDKGLPGPDHSSSLEPPELRAMVDAIRNVESAMGSGIKKPSRSEVKNRPIVRKSIVAACAIGQGEVFSEKNLTVKRPGAGISPMEWDKVLGLTAPRSFEEDELIET